MNINSPISYKLFTAEIFPHPMANDHTDNI